METAATVSLAGLKGKCACWASGANSATAQAADLDSALQVILSSLETSSSVFGITMQSLIDVAWAAKVTVRSTAAHRLAWLGKQEAELDAVVESYESWARTCDASVCMDGGAALEVYDRVVTMEAASCDSRLPRYSFGLHGCFLGISKELKRCSRVLLLEDFAALGDR